jgi:hypothetical protein
VRCYLRKRDDSPYWYICQRDERTGRLRRISTGETDRVVADRKLAEYILKLPALQASGDTTLVQIMLRYWQKHASTLPSRNEVRRAMGYVCELEPHTRIVDWDIPAQLAFVERMTGSATTRKRYFGTVCAAVRWHVNRGELKFVPPLAKVRAKGGKGVKGLDVEELRAVFAAAKLEHHRRLLVLCLIAAPRPGAALQVTWDRIDAKHGLIDFNVPGVDHGKKGRAIAPVAPTAARWLEARRSIGPVVQWHRKPLRSHSMAFRRLSEAVGFKVCAYQIRKGVSTWLRFRGVPELDIKGMIAHRMAGETERYAEYRPEYMRAAADGVEALIREIAPPWLPTLFPVAEKAEAVAATFSMAVNGLEIGPCRDRTCDQLLKRADVLAAEQQLKAANDD